MRISFSGGQVPNRGDEESQRWRAGGVSPRMTLKNPFYTLVVLNTTVAGLCRTTMADAPGSPVGRSMPVLVGALEYLVTLLTLGNDVGDEVKDLLARQL